MDNSCRIPLATTPDCWPYDDWLNDKGYEGHGGLALAYFCGKRPGVLTRKETRPQRARERQPRPKRADVPGSPQTGLKGLVWLDGPSPISWQWNSPGRRHQTTTGRVLVLFNHCPAAVWASPVERRAGENTVVFGRKGQTHPGATLIPVLDCGFRSGRVDRRRRVVLQQL